MKRGVGKEERERMETLVGNGEGVGMESRVGRGER